MTPGVQPGPVILTVIPTSKENTSETDEDTTQEFSVLAAENVVEETQLDKSHSSDEADSEVPHM